MSSKVFKNSQVTYGVPFQVRIPLAFQNIKQQEELQGIFVKPEEPEIIEKPEELIVKAQEEAAIIIREAEHEARKIMEDAYREAKEKAASMEEEAWQNGYAEGIAAAQKEYEAAIMEAEGIKANAAEEHRKALAAIEAEVIELVMKVSEKVIHSEISLNKENMIHLIKEALVKCSNKKDIIIKVAPEDYNFLDSNRDKLDAVIGYTGEIELMQDMSFKSGSCILETPFGNMDAGVGTKLRKIEEAFRELAGNSSCI